MRGPRFDAYFYRDGDDHIEAGPPRPPPVVAAALGRLLLYLPASFDAELGLSRTGLYKMSFDGYIVELTLYKDIREKKIDKEAEQKKAAIIIIADFTRDTSTKSASYFGQGAFHVKWSKGGDIIRSRQVTFFRRNENMLSITYNTYNKNTAIITLAGRYIRKQQAEQLQAMGLDVKGVIRIKTDAKVLSENSQKKTVKDGVTTSMAGA